MLAQSSVRSGESVGTRMLRTTYHYLFHTGEARAIHQLLGHPDLPYFVGDMPDGLFLISTKMHNKAFSLMGDQESCHRPDCPKAGWPN
jgi:hypothetical protein